MKEESHYIIYDDNIRVIEPEIETHGHMKTFPIGYRLTSERDNNHNSIITFGRQVFKSNNKIQTQIRFFELKLNHMKETGCNIYMPDTFKQMMIKYNNLVKQYPEYAV